MKIPPHIAEKADDSNATVMRWVHDRIIVPLDASTVCAYIKVIHHEYVGLLHTTRDTDEAFRARLTSAHVPFRNFSERYPTLFRKITTRESALHPPTMSLLLYQAHLSGRVAAGEIREEEAESVIARAATEMILKEKQHLLSAPPQAKQEPVDATPELGDARTLHGDNDQ